MFSEWPTASITILPRRTLMVARAFTACSIASRQTLQIRDAADNAAPAPLLGLQQQTGLLGDEPIRFVSMTLSASLSYPGLCI